MRALKSLARRTDLLDPESVKSYPAVVKLSLGRKAVLVQRMAWFYGYRRIPFDKPHYLPVDTLPFIPLESEIDQLISGVGKKAADYLQLLKKTGARPGEAWNLRWSDISSQNGTVVISRKAMSKQQLLRPVTEQYDPS